MCQWADHILVVATLWFHFKTLFQSNDHARVLHVSRLRECAWEFADSISGHFAALGKLRPCTSVGYFQVWNARCSARNNWWTPKSKSEFQRSLIALLLRDRHLSYISSGRGFWLHSLVFRNQALFVTFPWLLRGDLSSLAGEKGIYLIAAITRRYTA